MTNGTLGSDVEERLRLAIYEQINIRNKRRTRLHRAAVAGMAATVLIGGTAAAVVVPQISTADQGRSVVCYSASSLDASHGLSVSIADLASGSLAQRVADAQEQCAAGWRAGIDRLAGSAADARGSFPVPDLVTCELNDGRFAVFPSEGTTQKFCENLGLALPHD